MTTTAISQFEFETGSENMKVTVDQYEHEHLFLEHNHVPIYRFNICEPRCDEKKSHYSIRDVLMRNNNLMEFYAQVDATVKYPG